MNELLGGEYEESVNEMNEKVWMGRDTEFMYDKVDFPPLQSLSLKNKQKFENCLTGGGRTIIKGATKQSTPHVVITPAGDPPGGAGPYLHAHRQRSVAPDNSVLKDYVRRVYGEVKPRPEVHIKGNQQIAWGEDRVTNKQNLGTNKQNVGGGNRRFRKGRERKAFWSGITSFTDAPLCENINEAQLEVCKWFGEEEDEEEGEEENEEEEEELLSEVQGLLFNAVKAKQTKGRANKRPKNLKEEHRRPVIRIIENARDGGARVVEAEPGKQIWTLGRLIKPGEDKEGKEAQVTLVDPGNLSQSLMGVRTLRRFEKQLGKKIKLKPYSRVVKGAGGAKINLLGQTEEQLALRLPGFSRDILFQPIICSGPMSHINLALKALKKHEISLHMKRVDTELEDMETKERIKLFDREELMSRVSNNSREVVDLVNHLKSEDPNHLEAGDLMDLGQLEKSIRRNLRNHEVLLEREGGRYEVVNSLGEAWDVEDEIFGEGKPYPGNLEADIRKAKTLRFIDGAQALRPTKETVVERHTHCYVPCHAQVPLGRDFLITPSPATCLEAGGTLVTPTLGRMKNHQGLVHVSILNLTDEDIKVNKNEVVAYLDNFNEEEDEVISMTRVVEEEKEENKMYHKEWPPDSRRGPEEYKHSGFMLLDSKGKVEKYLNKRGEEQGAKERRRDFWRPSGPKIAQEEFDEARKEMWEGVRTNKERHPDPTLGQKTRSKKPCFQDKVELKKAEASIRIGEKGLFAHGKIFPNVTQIDEEKLKKEEKEEEEREARKRYLRELTKPELEMYIKKELRIVENEYLKDFPVLKEMVTQIFVENSAALTPAMDDPEFRYDPGYCQEIVYHPEIRPEHARKIFSAPVKKLAPEDDAELGRILRSWVRAGILRKQSIDDPNNRSEHNHRLVLVRKKPDGGTPGARPKPRRITLDLRDLNSCSYTHKHHLPSVQDHLASLEQGGIFTAWDLDNYFSSVPCSEYASRLLSFSTASHGSFSYRVLAQGWASAPGVAGALGARLCSVLDPGTLSLYVDDALQVGREGWVSREKLEGLGQLGDIEALILENPVEQMGEKVNLGQGGGIEANKLGNIDTLGSRNPTAQSEGKSDKSRGSKSGGNGSRGKYGPDVPSAVGLRGRARGGNYPGPDILNAVGLKARARGGNYEIGAENPPHRTIKTEKSFEGAVPLKGENFSPDDQRGMKINEDSKAKIKVNKNIDLLLKMRDFLKAVVRFNLRVNKKRQKSFQNLCLIWDIN